MTPEEMQMRCAAALRNAIELTEEGSELRGLVAEALAYADGDAGAFSDPPGAVLRLDIEDMSDALYEALLTAFREKAAEHGIDANRFDRFYDAWNVSCIVSKETDE